MKIKSLKTKIILGVLALSLTGGIIQVTSLGDRATAMLCLKDEHSSLQNENLPNAKIAPKEFDLSDSEKKDIEVLLEKAKTDSSSLFICNAAHDGNPVAMYIVGKQSELGIGGMSVNRSVANLYFSMAASLGYAPAMFEIFNMYTNENQDPLLALVYLNLTISFGHKECRDFYYHQIEQTSKIAGKSIVQEIEMIALRKTIKISEFQCEMEKLKGTYNPAIKFIGGNIVSDDHVYTEKYWEKFFNSPELSSQFFGKSQTM
jgi:TPR repeat protein